AIADLQARARRRLPHLAWEYLDCGTGEETAVSRNLTAFQNITMLPQFLKGELKPNITTTLFGQTYQAPFGIAPIGLSGLMWPKSELYLAETAVRTHIPYTLSTVATETPEAVGKHVGDMGWFQLYPPRDKTLRTDLLNRAKTSGFRTLVVTADIPIPSRRERLTRAGLKMPPAITARFVLQALLHPTWTVATLKRGLPRLRTIEAYVDSNQIGNVNTFVGQHMGGTLSWDYLQAVRDEWDGPLIIKGLLHPADAEKAVAIGVDAVQVSNHGGRQFDGSPAAIDALPGIVAAVGGKTAVLFDSGIRSGLDIVKAIALGADFVLLGRPFMVGVAALGRYGGDLVVEQLTADLKNNMMQLGVASLSELPGVR
ncbi:MAG: alpha-hydroxy-acid oxidizing protein, partial [Chloroflexi bacterium]|nr:alpha-hydroxy-acid oxidizing protein [Chloroflexota bacterium]